MIYIEIPIIIFCLQLGRAALTSELPPVPTACTLHFGRVGCTCSMHARKRELLEWFVKSERDYTRRSRGSSYYRQ